jgi:2,3-bisphosphoglycerate-dependent phosphoglycerate mutase
MKIYILRHEERVHDSSFFAPLTENGLNNSKKLIKDLEKLNINCIYSSPFIRTLQTITPYSKEYNLPVNVDYALSEMKNERIIPSYGANVTMPSYMNYYFNVNEDYRSTIDTIDISYPESKESLESRLQKFINHLLKIHDKNDVILLVTHQALCRSGVKMANVNLEYKMGELSLIYNNGWTYKKIN